MANKKYKNKKSELPPQGDAWPKKELFLFEQKTLFIIIITSVLTLIIAFFGERGAKFMTSVLSPIPEHAAFDGTTFPIKQVPNWVKLTEAERKAQYSAIPAEKLIPIPQYNPARLAIPTSSLKWNNAEDDAVRNEKITYSTPYLGDYRLNGFENVGSHPAIDIKAPEGTPVYAIANGTVIKAEISNGGFGNHIVLQHNNFPSPDDQNAKTTLFSSYSHLSSISVKVNDVVAKGQLIGFVGETGTATTPHLHFQIDNESSSWHPYWPFTSSDMKAAGLSFFDAINAGLKKENAIANTINPIRYVQKYFGEQSLMAASAPEVITAISAGDGYDDLTFVLQPVSGTQFAEGATIKFIIQAFDEQGNLVSNPKFKDYGEISLLNGLGVLNRSKLSSANLKTGISNILRLSETKVGKEKLLLRFRNHEFSSPEFEIIQKKALPAGFFVLPYSINLQKDDSTDIIIRAIDLNGNHITDFVLDEKPLVSLGTQIGNLSVDSIDISNFSNGEAMVKFNAVSAGNSEILVNYHGQIFRSPVISVFEPAPPPPPAPPPAPETTVEQPAPPESPAETAPPAAPAVTEPAAEQPAAPLLPEEPVVVEPQPPVYLPVPIVAGTSTENTAPAESQPQTEPQIQPQIPQTPFIDISAESKYLEALIYLKEKGFVAGYADSTFHPEREVSRAEAITFILRIIDQDILKNLVTPFPDVSNEAWYADFIATAFKIGFVKGYPDGTFKPQSTVTLAEFFTMYFVAAKIDIDPQVSIFLPNGMTAADWFTPYLQEAIKKNFLEVKDNIVEPGKSLTRGDIAEIMYRIKKLEELAK